MVQIHAAFVIGSVARTQDSATSDIDLMVISDSLNYADIFSALEAVNMRIGRVVNPTVLSPRQFNARVKAGNAFTTSIMAQPKIWLIGSENDLGV